MNQLKQDIDDLKAMGHISIARQYARMAKSLKEIRKYTQRCEITTIYRDHSAYMSVVHEETKKALRRFGK